MTAGGTAVGLRQLQVKEQSKRLLRLGSLRLRLRRGAGLEALELVPELSSHLPCLLLLSRRGLCLVVVVPPGGPVGAPFGNRLAVAVSSDR